MRIIIIGMFVALMTVVPLSSQSVLANTPVPLPEQPVADKASNVQSQIANTMLQISEKNIEMKATLQEIQELEASVPSDKEKINNHKYKMANLHKKLIKLQKDLEQLQIKLNKLQNSDLPKAQRQDARELQKSTNSNTVFERPSSEVTPESSSGARKSSNPFSRGTGQIPEDAATGSSQFGSCNSKSGYEGIPLLGLLLVPMGLRIRGHKFNRRS